MILAIALAALRRPTLGSALPAICLSEMPVFRRLARAQTRTIVAQDYLKSARTVDLRRGAIIARGLLPNIFRPVLVQATLTVASAFIVKASLSFLGLGLGPPSCGSSCGAKNFFELAPRMALWPGVAIFPVLLGFNLLGDGMRDALDPRD